MVNKRYSEFEAGVKTFWVIDFDSKGPQASFNKSLPRCEYISTGTQGLADGIGGKQLGVREEDFESAEQDDINLVLRELCDAMKEVCEKSAENQRELNDHSKIISEQINNLGKIVDKFHQIVSEFKNKGSEKKNSENQE